MKSNQVPTFFGDEVRDHRIAVGIVDDFDLCLRRSLNCDAQYSRARLARVNIELILNTQKQTYTMSAWQQYRRHVRLTIVACYY